MWKCKNCSETNPDSSQYCQSCGEKSSSSSSSSTSTSSMSYTSNVANNKNNTTSIIVTTTPYVEGKKIQKYLDVVSGTDIYLVGGVFGGGLGNQENLYGAALANAKSKMKNKAISMGADAVIGVQVSVTSPGGLNNIIVIANGTAVKFEQQESNSENL